MSHRVVLYSRAGCHLCVDAEQVVEQVCTELGEPWTLVDVDGDPLSRPATGTRSLW